MNDQTGNDVATLRELVIALARDAVFGREELIKISSSGRKNTGSLNRKKLDYIKTVLHTRQPNMLNVDILNKFGLYVDNLCQIMSNSEIECKM